MKPLEGKVALVTGASRGIGQGIAVSLAQAGAAVAINYRARESEAQQVAGVVESLGGRAFLAAADVADRGAMERMFAGVAQHFGHIDIVVANASYNSR